MKKYELEQKKSLMKLVAQKVSQKIDSLPQIECLSQRWIWELIQNAKDADNQFDRIHIQMELYDDKFVFKHNGCPFTESNIQSLIFHYSSKDDENKEELQTTGKYGTGFMVTYIISKKVRLNCMLKSSPEEDDQVAKLQKQLIIKKAQLQQMIKIFKTVKSDRIVTVKKSELKQSKIFAKATDNCDYYQQISLLMDRSYSSVDQLTQKLVLIDNDLRRQIQLKEKNYKYVRDQFSVDTEFVYQDLQQLSFKYIGSAMSSVKKLFPLTLLFNKKLSSIRFSNFSKNIKEPNFEILRQTNFDNPIKVSGFNIFSSAFYNHTNDNQREQKSKITVQYLYEVYKDINAIVAFPVKIQNKRITLMRFQSNFPKLFKELPMIGCKNTGFNFAITSRQFYPAQNRKQLMLRQIQGRKCLKVQTNWNILSKLFIKLKSTYILLSTKAKKGKFNLFYINNRHFLHRFNHTIIEEMIKSIKQSIANQKIFPSYKDSSKLLSLSQLSMFYQRYQPQKTTFQAYRLFSFLHNNSLCQQQFRQMNQYISLGTIYKESLQKMMSTKFYTIYDSMDLISEMGYQKFITNFTNKKSAEIHLRKIYDFLFQNHSEAIKQRNKKTVVNQNEQFMSYFDADLNIQAKIQYEFLGKQQLFMIARQLQIEFKNILIHKQYQSIFMEHVHEDDDFIKQEEREDDDDSQQQINDAEQSQDIFFEGSQQQIKRKKVLSKWKYGYFNKVDILKMINGYFQEATFTRQILIKLGRVISSFYRPSLLQILMAKQFKKYTNIDVPFQETKISIQTIRQQKYMATLEELFVKYFYTYMLVMYNQSKNLKEFSQNYLNNNKQIAINHIKYMMRREQLKITKFLNQMQEIVQCNPSSLLYLKNYDILSQADKQIYNKYFQSNNTINKSLSKLQSIQTTLVHRKISCFSSTFQFKQTTYNQLFHWMKNYYNNSKIKLEEKQDILNYTYSIYQQYIINNKKKFKQKFETFKQIIHQRHLQFGKLLNTLKDKDKDLICKIFKMKDKFDDIRDLFDHFSLEETLATMYKIKREEVQ